MRKRITIIDESFVRQYDRDNDQYSLTEFSPEDYQRQPVTPGHSIVDLTKIPSNKYGLLQSLPSFSVNKSAGRPVWLGAQVGPEIFAPLVKSLGAEVSGLPDFKVPLCIFSSAQQERMKAVFSPDEREAAFINDEVYLDVLVEFENEAKSKSQMFDGAEFDQRLFLDRAYSIGLLAVCCKANVDTDTLNVEHTRKFFSDRLKVLDCAWQKRDAEVPAERLDKIRSVAGVFARDIMKKTLSPNNKDLQINNS